MLSDSEDEFLFENSVLKMLQLSGTTRNYAVHPVNKERHRLGEYHHLFPQLKKYPDRFFQYIRMDYTTFKYILNLLSPHMATKYTNFVQQPIEPAEKLVITLRYFATGASFRSMSFAFRVGASTVSKIVRETACIMWDVLQPIHMPTPTKETFVQASSEFQELWNFPN
ncbi:unnamed protein product [Acanthoscelides obtectus]|uniref:Nuclease HARBI1 n=1 Tax=Acanthoscelides obtectus TaxID=200917 RepID=A0A9P0MCS2_ACAOB|nr:unnamed protein product [Acanthoscelides obtectus]CAK1680477.1 hypothetical protein AOBTE_LOCUS32686 [Acanthoscelides obtectus]